MVTVLVAASGYVAKYLNDLRLAQRTERLSRIDKQLRELYGRLFALHHTATAAWESFRRTYRKDISLYWSQDPPPNEREAEIWRLWHTEVFMPINEQIVRLVQEHADLLEEEQMPDVLVQHSVHVAAFKPVLKAWEAGNFERNTSVTIYPRAAFEKYTQYHYERLKKEQAEIIGTTGQGYPNDLSRVGGVPSTR